MTDISYAETVQTEKQKNRGSFLTPGNVFLLSAIITAAVIIGIALSRQLVSQPTSGPAPDFEFETFEGDKYMLSDLKGDVVVLNFWASWCGPCRDEAPDLQAVHEEYADEDVTFLGVAWTDNGPAARAFMQEFGITYLNAPDLGGRIGDKYNITGVPETFIIDKNGDIKHFFILPVHEGQLIDAIDGLLTDEENPA